MCVDVCGCVWMCVDVCGCILDVLVCQSVCALLHVVRGRGCECGCWCPCGGQNSGVVGMGVICLTRATHTPCNEHLHQSRFQAGK